MPGQLPNHLIAHERVGHGDNASVWINSGTGLSGPLMETAALWRQKEGEDPGHVTSCTGPGSDLGTGCPIVKDNSACMGIGKARQSAAYAREEGASQ